MTAKTNPLEDMAEAKENSSYGRVLDGELEIDSPSPNRMAPEVHSALKALLHDPEFPCVGAKSIVNQSSYRFGLYSSMESEAATAGLAYDLYRFVEERPSLQGEFTSFIASFQGPKVQSAAQFERLLWRQLKELREIDKPFHAWNEEVSSDPANPSFSFSFAGNAFFVVGLSPSSQRWARHFPWPTLVFNDHFQFERLREEQRFDRIRDVIRERDLQLQGSTNPMLADYGTHSEARQYSGRNVPSGWRCPVHFEEEEEKP